MAINRLAGKCWAVSLLASFFLTCHHHPNRLAGQFVIHPESAPAGENANYISHYPRNTNCLALFPWQIDSNEDISYFRPSVSY